MAITHSSIAMHLLEQYEKSYLAAPTRKVLYSPKYYTVCPYCKKTHIEFKKNCNGCGAPLNWREH